MKLLLVSPDANLVRLMSRMLADAGHTAATAGDARSAMVQVASALPAVMVIDERLPDTSGLALLRQVRRRDRGDTPRVILLAADPSAVPRAELDELHVDHVVGRPPSLLDLVDLVGGLASGRPTPTRPPPATRASAPNMLNLGNVARLGGWWSQRATGVIRIDMDGGTTRWVSLVEGGPVDAEGRARLVEALGDGSVELDRCDVDGEGDRAAFGRELWAVVRPWVATRVRPEANLVVTPTSGVLAVGDLPLPASLRRILTGINRPTSLDTIRASVGAASEDLVADITALALLTVVFTHAARPAAPASPTGDGPSQATSPQTSPRSAPRTVPSVPRVDRPFSAGEPSVPVVPDPPSYARARRDQDPPSDPKIDPPTRPIVPDPGAVAREVLRLRREVKVVEGADAWTVLALPRGTTLDIVRRTVDRMTARYEPLAASPHGEIREAAQRLLAAIRRAWDELQRGGAPSAPSADVLLAAGRNLLDRGDWAGADRRFTAARDADPDSARALAWLGYARFHNPAHDEESRHEEGIALLDLALEYDRDSVDAHYLRAVLAERAGDVELTRRHLGAVFRVDPAHEQARALAARLPQPAT